MARETGSYRLPSADTAFLHMDRPTNLMVINCVMLFDEPHRAEASAAAASYARVWWIAIRAFANSWSSAGWGWDGQFLWKTPTSMQIAMCTVAHCPRPETKRPCGIS